MAIAMCGMMFGGMFGGCNFQRILAGVVDHTVFSFVQPFIGDLTGALTGEEE